jgi:hypothetical protein
MQTPLEMLLGDPNVSGQLKKAIAPDEELITDKKEEEEEEDDN